MSHRSSTGPRLFLLYTRFPAQAIARVGVGRRSIYKEKKKPRLPTFISPVVKGRRSLYSTLARPPPSSLNSHPGFNLPTFPLTLLQWLLLLLICLLVRRRRQTRPRAGSHQTRQSTRRQQTWYVTPGSLTFRRDVQTRTTDAHLFPAFFQFQQAGNAFKIEKSWDSSGRAFDQSVQLTLFPFVFASLQARLARRALRV